MPAEMNETGQEIRGQHRGEAVGLVNGLERPGTHQAFLYRAIFITPSGEDGEIFFMFCLHETESESLTQDDKEQKVRDYCEALMGPDYAEVELGSVRIRLSKSVDEVSIVRIMRSIDSSMEAADQAKKLLEKDVRYSFTR